MIHLLLLITQLYATQVCRKFATSLVSCLRDFLSPVISHIIDSNYTTIIGLIFLDPKSNPLLLETKEYKNNFDGFGFDSAPKQNPAPGPMKPIEVKAPSLLPASELARDLELADLEVNNAPLPELEDLKFEPEPISQHSNNKPDEDYEEDKLEPASKYISTQAPNLIKDKNSGAMVPAQPKRSDFGYNNPGAYKEAMHEWRNKVKSIRSSSRGAYKLDTSADAFAGLALKSLGDKPEEEAKQGNEIPAENPDNYLPNFDEKCPDWDVDYGKLDV